MVYFEDKEVGKTPLQFDFLWYGKRHIRIEKEGFETLENTENIRAPFFMIIPLDLASEALPITLKDIRSFSYKLVPKQEIIIDLAPPEPIKQDESKPLDPKSETTASSPATDTVNPLDILSNIKISETKEKKDLPVEPKAQTETKTP